LLGATVIAPPSSSAPPQPLPLGDLPLAAHEILVERDVVVLDQIGPAVLDEPGAVLGEVLGRLGREVAEVVEHLVAHPVPVRDPTFGRHPAQPRVEILAAVLEPEVEGDVVDPGAEVIDLVRRHP